MIRTSDWRLCFSMGRPSLTHCSSTGTTDTLGSRMTWMREKRELELEEEEEEEGSGVKVLVEKSEAKAKAKEFEGF